MKSLSIIISLLLFVFGCNKSKKEDLEKIEKLEKEILRQQNVIAEQQETIQKTQKLFEDSQSKIETNSRKRLYEKDSILKHYQISTALDAMQSNEVSNYSGMIDYQSTSNDSYWKRGIYYASEDTQEYFFNVRVSTFNNNFRVYFMGVKYPLKKGELLVSIYELDENKNISLIDTVNLSIIEGLILNYEDKEADYAFFQFALMQSDNLILRDNELFYYKARTIKKQNYHTVFSDKEFYKYSLGSKEKSTKINRYVISNIIANSADDIINISPDKSRFVSNRGEVMGFYKISDWNKQKQLILTSNIYKNIKEINFNLGDYIKSNEEEAMYIDEDTNEGLLFGGTSWHSTKNILYFDNSGVTYRCIWEIDFNNKKVTKIVPEHEAIHPYFFTTIDKEYIIYTEKNKIMICEPPTNFN